MKLIRFAQGDAPPSFGLVIADHAVSFAVLQQRSGITAPQLSDSQAYLAGLPESEQAARKLLAWGEAHLDELRPARSCRSRRCVCTSRSRWWRCSISA